MGEGGGKDTLVTICSCQGRDLTGIMSLKHEREGPTKIVAVRGQAGTVECCLHQIVQRL